MGRIDPVDRAEMRSGDGSGRRHTSYVEIPALVQPTWDTTPLGSRYEISYDIVMSDDMGFVEGCYRLPGHLWQVLLFAHKDVPALSHSFGTWRSGVTGVEFGVPRGTPINHEFVVSAMSEVFGAASWTVVNGPDSLVLR